MVKKIILTALCISAFAAFSAEYAAASYEAVEECYAQMYQKFPSLEAIKKQFGSRAKWRRKIEPSPHDDSLELKYDYMESPGIKINTANYELNGDKRFFVLAVDVARAGLTDFLGIDVGSAQDDVIKKFGRPSSVNGSEFYYGDEEGFTDIVFVIEKNKVAKMTFRTYLD